MRPRSTSQGRRLFTMFAVATLIAASGLALLLIPAQAGIVPQAPSAQPSGLAVLHRSGQSFITWRERSDLIGESYRIYRHDEPITGANLGEATFLYEVPAGSARFYANRYHDFATPPNWINRYVDHFVIEDLGEELAEGTGLLVWTLSTADLNGANTGNGFYAVTTVDAGTENVTDFGTENTVGPISEAVGDPQPVKIVELESGWHAFIQYMDLRNWNPTFHAPNNTNNYYGFDSSTPEVANAIQYAYDYAVFVPGTEQCGDSLLQTLPVLVTLHAWMGNTYGPPVNANNLCAYVIAPVDETETWWFGFAQDHDFRTGGLPAAGDRIVNYTEARVLRMIYDLLRDPIAQPADANRIYVSGHSMGASGALALALRYPNVFAAAYASKPMTNYREAGSWLGSAQQKWGPVSQEISVTIVGPDIWAEHLQMYNGESVWDWQNHQANLLTRQGDDVVPFALDQGINDNSIAWTTQGEPIYGPLNASRQTWSSVILDNGHNWGDYQGLSPNLFLDGMAPFAGLEVKRNETVPGFSNASSNLTVSPDITPTSTGGYNQALLWSSSWQPWDGPPLDTTAKYQLGLCSTEDGSAIPICGGNVTQTVDVTLRRVQNFPVSAGGDYRWQNRRVSDGVLVDSGQVQADANGLLTVPQFAVSSAGNRLIILSDTLSIPTTLAVTVIGEGSVTVSPQQVQYHYGQEVTLEAAAETGWSFGSWSGGVYGTNPRMKVTLAGTEQITAAFVREGNNSFLPLIRTIDSASTR